jgi:hypothetical protein
MLRLASQCTTRMCLPLVLRILTLGNNGYRAGARVHKTHGVRVHNSTQYEK